MTAGGFEIRGTGVRGVAGAMRDNSDLAALAGTALAGLGSGLPAPAVGERLDGTLAGLSAAWCHVLDDMVFSLAGLAGWLDDAVRGYFSVDTETSYRFGTIHP